MWTLGKTAALVATARIATRQQERTRRLGERIELAREIHERVMQRLFGVSLVLSAEKPLDRRGARALPGRDAGGARRPAHARWSGRWRRSPRETGTTLRAEMARGWCSTTGPPVQRGLA